MNDTTSMFFKLRIKKWPTSFPRICANNDSKNEGRKDQCIIVADFYSNSTVNQTNNDCVRKCKNAQILHF